MALFYSTQEVVAHCRVKKDTLLSWVRRGKLPSPIRFGSQFSWPAPLLPHVRRLRSGEGDRRRKGVSRV
jgi:hypothetical protein